MVSRFRVFVSFNLSEIACTTANDPKINCVKTETRKIAHNCFVVNSNPREKKIVDSYKRCQSVQKAKNWISVFAERFDLITEKIKRKVSAIIHQWTRKMGKSIESHQLCKWTVKVSFLCGQMKPLALLLQLNPKFLGPSVFLQNFQFS